MNKNKLRRNRPDMDGNELGLYRHNKAILKKTASVCALCGLPFDKSLKFPDPMSVSIDHIIPVAKGGKSTFDNLQATHLICNKAKGIKVLTKTEQDRKINEREQSIPQYIDWANYEG